ENDLARVMVAILSGKDVELRWSDEAVVGVVLASGGYPGAYDKGVPIEGLDKMAAETLVFHAGTKQENGQWQTNGGRILLVASRAATIEAAQQKVYEEMKHLSCAHAFYRKDIAGRAIS
ncbi:MAG TPA: phosphoribosylglycinamide synthetase C domain-containing protein, partial [Bacillales bacterium]|nr:phosphoribosylglycinamide synthetase C domain-containing protein [Bacillales bacterium]